MQTKRTPHSSSERSGRTRRFGWTGLLIAVVAVGLLAAFGRFEYAYMPPLSKVLNPERNALPAYDVLGRSVGHEEAERLLRTPEGQALLSPANGAIRIDEDFLEFGREAFYKETFDNEWFLSDVIGALDGPITPWGMTRALIALAGRGTDNLQVRLAHDVRVGGREFRKGELIDTGIDVVRGAFAPIGFKMVYDRGRIRTGVACAACHVTVDPATGKAIEGPANPDINMGLILALAPNSAAYFGRTDVDLAKRDDLYVDPTAPEVDAGQAGSPDTRRLEDAQGLIFGLIPRSDSDFAAGDQLYADIGRTAPTPDGRRVRLPDPQRLEDAVDAILLHWPPGNFDTTVDLQAIPTRTPDSFTLGDHPYGWNGFGQIGPFQGLSTLGNNVHSFNADPSIEYHAAPIFFDLDPSTYLAVLLQNASRERFRYDPESGESALEFFERVNPNPDSPGMSQTAKLPSYPNATKLSPHSIVVSRRGHPIWSHINAMSAFQHSLRPPRAAAGEIDPALFAHGKAVFTEAGCDSCHVGAAFTNNRVLPVSQIGTEPDRAKALEKLPTFLDPVSTTWAWDTLVPVPEGARVLEVPTDLRTPEEQQRILAQDGEGGYKVKGLIGLRFTAPYLHMGGVAVGSDLERDLGIPGTLQQGILPDPANSLRALVDRSLRQRIIAANATDPMLSHFNVSGIGHAQWVDEPAGFSAEDQDALVHYLLYLDHDETPSEGPAPVGQFQAESGT
jgi:hypothetical protein